MQIDWIIYRFEQTDKGTISANIVRNNLDKFSHVGFNIELPWRNNLINQSCIPAGFYKFKQLHSERLGKCIEIQNVMCRTNILAHIGNYMKDTKGCILPCMEYSYTNRSFTPYGKESLKGLHSLLAQLPLLGYVHIVNVA